MDTIYNIPEPIVFAWSITEHMEEQTYRSYKRAC